VLFYDKRLSANQTISCASCHQREHGFSDGRRFSVGLNGGLTSRNAMGLTNARYYQRRHFFWDERANTLEDQVLQPIQNAVEMGMTLPALITRLNAEPFYKDLCSLAFGDPELSEERISRALAQFVRSIISTRSKFDQGIPQGFANFTPQENLGRQIFFGQVGNATCAACHGTDNFVPVNTINNNGLENPYLDKGIGEITGLARDEGLFKVPSLRNIELTAPYMHDGRFSTLEEVVEFYNSGVTNHPNLSPPLRVPTPPGAPPGPPRRLNLTDDQKTALIAFLKTLTDRTALNDPKFSDPFNYGN
jgi:cytochrome c peroxidase